MRTFAYKFSTRPSGLRLWTFFSFWVFLGLWVVGGSAVLLAAPAHAQRSRGGARADADLDAAADAALDCSLPDGGVADSSVDANPCTSNQSTLLGEGSDAKVDASADAQLDASTNLEDSLAPPQEDLRIEDLGIGGFIPPAPTPPDEEVQTVPVGPKDVVSDAQSIIRTILGLLLLLGLAVVGAHPRVASLERRVGIAQLTTTGLPYVLLGMFASSSYVNVLNAEVLRMLAPLLLFGLGWIGFHTGFEFDLRTLEKTPKGTSSLVLALTAVPFFVVALASAGFLYGWNLGVMGKVLALDATLLGLAGSLSAPTLSRIVQLPRHVFAMIRTVSILDDIVGVFFLAILGALAHPSLSGAWQMPTIGWFMLTLGLAATSCLLMFAVLRQAENGTESRAFLLGSVALTSGMASILAISPLVVGCFAAMFLRNLPGSDKPGLSTAFSRVERSIYNVFLVVVGALFRGGDIRGWLLLPIFVAARMLGRYIGTRLVRALPDEARHDALADTNNLDLIAAPMGPLAIALVVTAQTLYESPALSAIVTAVVGGSLAFELIVQVSFRYRGTSDSNGSGNVPPGNVSKPSSGAGR